MATVMTRRTKFVLDEDAIPDEPAPMTHARSPGFSA